MDLTPPLRPDAFFIIFSQGEAAKMNLISVWYRMTACLQRETRVCLVSSGDLHPSPLIRLLNFLIHVLEDMKIAANVQEFTRCYEVNVTETRM